MDNFMNRESEKLRITQIKKFYKKRDFKEITSAAASSSLALPSAMLPHEDIYWTSIEA
jgi:hypothetical protein